MKFIRDIIGEKRQRDPSINGEPTDVFTAEDATSPRMASEIREPAFSLSEDMKADKFEAQSEDPTPLPAQGSYEADHGVSEEVAKFFAETDDLNLFEDDFDENDFDEIDFGSEDLDTADQDAVAPETSDNLAPDAHAPVSEPKMQETEHDADDEIDTASQTLTPAQEIHSEEDATPVEDAAWAAPETASDHPSEEPETPEVPEPVMQAPSQASAFAIPSARPSDETRNAQPFSAPAPDMSQRVEVPQPAVGRGMSRHGRVKTRLLGFNTAMEIQSDPMSDNEKATAAPYTSFPVGWLIVVDGAGRGSAFTLFHGVSTIGRGENQTIRLDFGDNSISRESHASIAYDDRQKGFYIGHGGKANIVRRNDRPVLSTEELSAGDTITIGETTLRFVPFCCPEFSWEQQTETGRAYANQG